MKKIIYSSLLVLAITLLPSACDNDSDMNSPHGSTTPPEQVVLNGVKNLPGKSIIYFTQPSDKNFLYMKAVYMTEIGERSTNASYFADSVVVEGFEKAGEYNVKLYSVSPGEAYSEPLEVKINPEEPPYITAYKEMEIKPDFAGIRIKTSNTTMRLLLFMCTGRMLLENGRKPELYIPKSKRLMSPYVVWKPFLQNLVWW